MNARSPRFLLAPNAFKGSLSAVEAARSMARGIRAVFPAARLELLPLSDGGPGMLDALGESLPSQARHLRVAGPLGTKLSAAWRLAGSKALIESAQAIGLERVKGKLKPMLAGSRGLGQLLLAARRAGAKEAWLGLGGSASTDGGSGMARALGWRFLDAAGRELPEGGGSLGRLARVLPPRRDALRGMRIRVFCDVNNPLCGPRGAARVFGPQKGATPAQARRLDQGLGILSRLSRKRSLALKPGAGAAGGLGFGLMAFCRGTLEPGASSILKLSGFHALLRRCDWVLTGEGSLDAQSLAGKLPVAVGREAKKAGKPCLALAGSARGSAALWRRQGLSAVVPLKKPGRSLRLCMDRAAGLVELETRAFFRRI